MFTYAEGEDKNVEILNLDGIHVRIMYKTSVPTSQRTESVSFITTVSESSR